jgi:hypothetical protein
MNDDINGKVADATRAARHDDGFFAELEADTLAALAAAQAEAGAPRHPDDPPRAATRPTLPSAPSPAVRWPLALARSPSTPGPSRPWLPIALAASLLLAALPLARALRGPAAQPSSEDALRGDAERLGREAIVALASDDADDADLAALAIDDLVLSVDSEDAYEEAAWSLGPGTPLPSPDALRTLVPTLGG